MSAYRATTVDEEGHAASAVRLDPAGLPHRFRMHTDLAGTRTTVGIWLTRDRVRLERVLPSGLPAQLDLPTDAFEAVAARVMPGDMPDTFQIVVELLHADPALSVPLAVTHDLNDIIADWRAWGRVFNLPLIMIEMDGAAHIIENRMGNVVLKATQPRRRSVLNRRRPRFLARRRMGVVATEPVIYAGEREITARN